jgi:hypothetical protein
MADSLIDTNNVDDTNARAELLAKWKDKTPEEVLNAKIESDLYIKTLTARTDQIRDDYLRLREEAQAKASLQDLIDRHEKSLNNPDTSTHTNVEQTQPSLKAEDIETLLEQKLSQRELMTKQNTNFNAVKAKLQEQFGDNYNTVLKQRMDTLGLDQEFTDNLAKTHPSVFLKTFGLDAVRQDSYSPPPRSNQRPDRFAPVAKKRDWNYYQELNKRDPRAYLDPKIAIQMHNDAIALGNDFGMPSE